MKFINQNPRERTLTILLTKDEQAEFGKLAERIQFYDQRKPTRFQGEQKRLLAKTTEKMKRFAETPSVNGVASIEMTYASLLEMSSFLYSIDDNVRDVKIIEHLGTTPTRLKSLSNALFSGYEGQRSFTMPHRKLLLSCTA